jgi:hypothetical protein
LSVLVVDRLLEQGLRDPLHDPSDDLALDDLRVDDRAHIVDSDVLGHLDVAGLGVDLDRADVRSEGEDEVLRVEERRLLETRLETVRHVVAPPSRERDLGDRLPHGGSARHEERARLVLEVARRHLELVRRDLPRLVDHLPRRPVNGRCADRRTPAPVRVPAARRDVGVAEQDLHIVHGNAEGIGDDLRERRLVALSMRGRAHDDDDLPRRVTPDRGCLPATARVPEDAADDLRWPPSAVLEVGGEADPDLFHLASLATGLLLLARLLVVEQLQRLVERSGVVAGIDREATD